MSKKRTNYYDKETGEQKNLFYKFYQHSFPVMNKMLSEMPKALEMFNFLIHNMGNNNALVISQNALSDALKCSRSTVARCTKYLKEKNAIELYKSGNTNIYAVNSDIVWVGDDDKKAYSVFNAKVYITLNEQDEELKRSNFQHAKVQKKSKLR